MDQLTQYLAFDLGASHGRAILGTLHGANFEMEEIHRFSTPYIKKGGHLYWDLEKIWDELQTGLKGALQKSENLCSLSVSSWGVDYVPLDVNGQALRNAYSYRDGRTSSILDDVHSKVSEAAFYRATGIKTMPINTLYQIYWDYKYEPEIFEKTANRLMIADYFNYRFSGRKAVEKSLASTSQMLNVKTGAWAKSILKKLDFSLESYPEIVPSGTILGNVKHQSFGKVIASCSHDTACAVASVPAAENDDGWAFLSCGTWSLLGVERSTPILSDQARQLGFTNESGPGDSIRFLRNLNGLWILQECEREWRDAGQSYSYNHLLSKAGTFADSNTVPIVDLNKPQFGKPGNMILKLYEYCEQHNSSIPRTSGAVVATILKSLAHSYAQTIKMIEQVNGESIETLHIVGGGTKNKLLCQWTADACGCKVMAGPAEATAIGNILMQVQALGHLPANYSLRDVVRNYGEIDSYLPSDPGDQYGQKNVNSLRN